ncbi:hypothetical protein VULLAG_LOCUS9959 [Vulpes lagopus]
MFITPKRNPKPCTCQQPSLLPPTPTSFQFYLVRVVVCPGLKHSTGSFVLSVPRGSRGGGGIYTLERGAASGEEVTRPGSQAMKLSTHTHTHTRPRAGVPSEPLSSLLKSIQRMQQIQHFYKSPLQPQ